MNTITSIFQAEASAVPKAIEMANQTEKIVILSDSLSTVKAINSCNPESNTVTQIQKN